eukprot:11171025-Lingulodinium_polyedra.AAC.1
MTAFARSFVCLFTPARALGHQRFNHPILQRLLARTPPRRDGPIRHRHATPRRYAATHQAVLRRATAWCVAA